MTTAVVTVKPETPIKEIAALLLERRISAVPVVDEAGRVVGIVSEGDLMHRPELGAERRPAPWLGIFMDPLTPTDFLKRHGVHARNVMTREVVTVAPETELGEIARLLEQNRIKRVPVCDDGRLVGIVSRANLLQALAAAPPAGAAAGPSDAEIRRRIVTSLESTDWAPTLHINVVVAAGIVHLWGVVRSEEQRVAIRAAAESTPGVRGIEDHLSTRWFFDQG